MVARTSRRETAVLNSKNQLGRPHCEKQIYASVEVAEETVDHLLQFGLVGDVEKCELCGRIHVVFKSAN